MSRWRVLLGTSMEPSMRGLPRGTWETPMRTVWRTTGSWTPAMVVEGPTADCSTLDLRLTPVPQVVAVTSKFMPTSR